MDRTFDKMDMIESICSYETRTTCSDEDLKRTKTSLTVDEILDLSTQVLMGLDTYTPREIDDIIGDLSLTLAHQKREAGNGKKWKYMTLDMETQALICKLAEIEVNLVIIEEYRMEITLAPLRRSMRRQEPFRRTWNRVESLARRLGIQLRKEMMKAKFVS